MKRIDLLAGAVLIASVLPAQEAAKPPAEFEVASVKPNATGGHNIRIQIEPGGRFVAENLTVRMLIQQAFGIRDFQIVGAPGWVNSEHYDIHAKAEGVTKVEQLKPPLQALLADRFHFQFHRDTKELPMYALVVAKNGPKLQEHAGESGDNGPGMFRMGRGMINAQGVQMSLFVNQLANQIGRSVVDKTGLTGRYDIKLEWTPDENQTMAPRDSGTEATPVDSSGPSLFTALQQQLGLKLESQKGPVEIVVIDRIEKPTEN